MLFGIGNPAILTKAGVKPIIENLCVGENLQDHPATATGYELIKVEKSLGIMQDEARAQELFRE